MEEKAQPIRNIFLGIVGGESCYKEIFPEGYCLRDGYRLRKRSDGVWTCQTCGLIVQTKNQTEVT